MLEVTKLLLRVARARLLGAVLLCAAAGSSSVLALAAVSSMLRSGDAGELTSFALRCVVALLTSIAASAVLTRLSADLTYDFRAKLARSILAAPLRDLEAVGPAPLLTTLMDDVSSLAHASMGLPVMLTNFVAVAACLAYMLWLSPKAFVATLALLALGLGIFYLFKLAGDRRLSAFQRQRARLMGYVRGLVEGVKELKLNEPKRSAFVDEGLLRTSGSMRSNIVAGNLLFYVAGSFGNSLFFVALGLLLFAGERLGESREVVVGYILTILFLRTPVEAIVNQLPTFSLAAVSIERIESLGLSLHPEAVKGAPRRVPARTFGSLELVEIVHTYRREDTSSPFRLGPLSLSLEPGKILLLAGGNGSGKSTVAKVLAGLYTPEGGDILLDGAKIDDASRESYRQLFSAVFSDYHLFETLYGIDPDTIAREAPAHLKKLRLDKKISVTDSTFSTTALSSGQRKRLALLSALLEDRPIYIFDEWTSDQDPSFKKIFYMDILPYLKERKKAVLVITHDDRYFHVADQLLKLEDGQLVGDATGEFLARMR